MNMLLKFLIYALQTADGCRGSAAKLVEVRANEILKTLNFQTSRDRHSFRALRQAQYEIANKTLFKYKLMKFRSKLSLMAFQKLMTVRELVLVAVIKTYQTQQFHGDKPPTNNFK